jgi:aspartate/methionine/tyrosine aminotransferase
VNRTESLTFVLNGLSKAVGLPQMKMSWIIACGDSILAKVAKSRLEIMLDFYLSVSTPIQIAAAKLLSGRRSIQKQISSRIDLNSKFLEKQTANTSNCRMLKREGGWYSIIKIADDLTDEDRVLKLLDYDNVLVHPGYFYDFDREGFIVLSLLSPVETFQTGVLRLIKRFCRAKR